MATKKGSMVRLLKAQSGFKEGSCGKVLAVRDVKESDVDVQELKKNGIQMALGPLALVKFSRGRKVIPMSDLVEM